MQHNKRFSMEQKKARWGWIFVAPSLLFLLVFSFYPIFNAIYMSFFKKNLLSLKPPEFVGWGNYAYLFHSKTFWQSVSNTAIFTIGTFIPLVVFSLMLAVFIVSRRRFQKSFQMALYSPAALSSVVAALIWLLIFDPRGLANQTVNTLLRTPGVNYHWLSRSNMLRLSTIIVSCWKYVGYFTDVFVAGIGGITDYLHEAELINGADSWKDFWYITFPLLKPTTLLVSVMVMLQCLKTFSTQYLFSTSGAPTRPIDVITLCIYITAIKDYNIGRASAMSVLLFLVMLILTWMQLKIARTEDVTYN